MLKVVLLVVLALFALRLVVGAVRSRTARGPGRDGRARRP